MISGMLRPVRGGVADAALAGGVFLLVGLGSLRSLVGAREEPWSGTVIDWVLLAAACAALAWWRRYPVAVAVFVLAATAAYYLTSHYDGPLMVAFVVALYGVAAGGRLRAAVVIAAVALIGTGAGTLAGNGDVNGVALFMFAGWLVAVVSLGWAWHTRRAHAREAERRAAGEERLRIARELHDDVGHHLSLINVQAAAALRRLRRNAATGPEQAEAALDAIKQSSREALRELRATLGMLREAGERAPTAPPPSLARIGELAASARLAGLDVRTHISGGERSLPAEVELAAYRIAQESLTNVARHARATAATVRIDCGPRQVTVEVTDDGRGPAGGPGGSGIAGMRERARALGGEMTAGPAPGGGFAVRACLPTS
ncbi:sensor histidine kinase [Actinomadura macrotermitis]|uniref:histidine kinase n=1 Tax=Actinomadura macrotermitis TaxID=2585200 RepID=A0A7K0BSB7_9ACTN|nr:histidine kinase [Actinomadura macrotermitis]MQY04093.1 hypothetical protein [Actinomadura macrotermitis]